MESTFGKFKDVLAPVAPLPPSFGSFPSNKPQPLPAQARFFFAEQRHADTRSA
jgi:hypothetical protein